MPDEERIVLLRHEGRKLGKVVRVKKGDDANGPVVVKLAALGDDHRPGCRRRRQPGRRRDDPARRASRPEISASSLPQVVDRRGRPVPGPRRPDRLRLRARG